MVLEDEAEAVGHLDRDVPRRDRGGRAVHVVDRRHEKEHEERRHERERRDVHRVRRAECRDRKAADRRPEDARGSVDPEVRGVRAGELARLDECGDHAEVRGHSPGNLDCPEQEADEVQKVEAEYAGRDRDRDRERQRNAQRVARDEELPLIRAIDEYAEKAAEEYIRERLNETERCGCGDRMR